MTATPRVNRYLSAGGVVVDKDRVLLLRRPSRDEIRLPKGHVEANETAENAAIREVGEESGYVALRVTADLGSQLVEFKHDGVFYERTERCFLMELISGVAPIAPETQFEPLWMDWSSALKSVSFESEREWLSRGQDHPQRQQPRPEVVEEYGLLILDDLGGRRRRHWLVESDRERYVLRRWQASPDDIAYELAVITAAADLGWPAPRAIAEPVEYDGFSWCVFAYCGGEPPSTDDPLAEQRARGRLLAEFHQAMSTVAGLGQREGWRRCEEILHDPAIDRLLAGAESDRPEEIRALRWHLERARDRITSIGVESMPSLIIHGDFAPWNLRFRDAKLSGLLDFEFSHLDHRVADFALSWRGKHDAIVHAYNEVWPLTEEERELLTPMWWAWLIEGASQAIARGQRDDGWTMSHLMRRSSLMGIDEAPYPPSTR